MKQKKAHRGWILPYLPNVFHVQDYRALSRSKVETPQARAQLNRYVKEGRLEALGDDRYRKLGNHMVRLTYNADGSIQYADGTFLLLPKKAARHLRAV